MPSLNLPTPNKTPGDGSPAGDMNLVIETINTLQSEVDNIPAGPQGPQGEPGTPGADGAAATITVSSTNTTAPGADAQVIQGGTAQNATLAFYIPRGATGPTGATGAQGEIGPTGPQGERGPSGYGVIAGGADGYVLAKASNTDYDTEWIPAGAAPPVSSVDGRTGVVTLTDLYDAAGDAAAAQSAAEDYADGLASNYDPAGSASAVAGDLTTHEAATTTVHGISNTANLVYTSDSRLSDARTPTAHASTHAAAGSDPVTLAQSQVTNLTTDLAAKASSTDLTTHVNATTSVHGISDTANLVYTNDSRLSDARTPTAHASSHESGGSDELELAPGQVTGTALVASTVNAKGDLLVASADNTVTRLAVGTDTYVLTADAAEATGLKWAVAAAPVDPPIPVAFFLGGM